MKLTPIKGIFALLIGMIILKIFFPWWFVTLIIGGATCFAVYKWVTIKTGVSPVWAKRFAGLAIVIFLISLFVTFFETKWPWVAKALDSRQLVISLGIADWLKSKEPLGLRMKMEKLREELMKAEEQKYIKKIEPIEAKIVAGQELTEADQKIIKEAEEKLKELQKKAAEEKLQALQGKADEKAKQNSTQKAESRPPKVAELARATVVVPAGEIVNTHFWTRAHQRIYFYISGGGADNSSTPLYYVHGDTIEVPVYSKRHSCEFSGSDDYIWLKGGPVTIIVIIERQERGQKFNQETENDNPQDLQKNQTISSSPSKPVELAFLGKDCKFLKFEENEHVIRSPNWIIKLVSIKCVEDGKLKLKFLHRSLNKNSYSKSGLVWIENPEETTYLVDESGRRIGFLKEQNLGTKINQKGITVLGKEFPAQVPISYSMIFSRPKDNVRVISFISKYSWCRYLPCFEQEDVVIRGVKLFIEKSQMTEINNPPEKERSSEVSTAPESQLTSEREAAREIEPEGKMAKERATEQWQEVNEEKKDEKQVSEEKKPSQPKKSVGRQILERMLRDGQRSQRYPYRRY